MGGFYQEFAWAVAVGGMATGFMDLCALARTKLLGTRAMNWANVGRWVGHLARGQLVLTGAHGERAVRFEQALGWAVHYGVGIALAGLLQVILGAQALLNPQPLAIIGFGVTTVALPMLILQPGLGLGVAGRKTAAPWGARRASVLTHLIFGVGLYLAALVVAGALR